ncbi:MAG TPA: choice-of-anchor tandem repeat GloVer-containing protein [Terriglobales bacterium]|jgi:uncharacterized repeat protein (TIGR03803 family)|nr:choice-of-anchor tandem repeat GloVer-containing protein [Terriglobales bacterium]
MTKVNRWKVVSVMIVIFSAAIAMQGQKFETLVKFDGTNGGGPGLMNLVQGRDGNLYGTSRGGGANNFGLVFKIGPLGNMVTLYSFCSKLGCADGYSPVEGLVSTIEGTLYGVTTSGGTYGVGTIFKITSDGSLSTLYSFCSQSKCSDGGSPEGALVQGTDGDLYGTTYGGGSPACQFYGCGTVFKITPKGQLTTLHSFDGTDGANPIAPLVQATDGKFYGTAAYPGNSQYNATAFSITPRGAFATLHNFNSSNEGNPLSGLIQASDGNFYGVTPDGGVGSWGCGGSGPPCGMVFRLGADGNLTTIYSFCTQSSCPDGALPFGRLVQATDGSLYGSTEIGGAYGEGTLFRITLDGNLTTLHSFCAQKGCPDGAWPNGGLSQSTQGPLYGTTEVGGGKKGAGTIFGLNMGLSPFVAFVVPGGSVGSSGSILGQGFTGTTSVMLNGVPAQFHVVSDTYLTATVPPGATTGYVTVTTPKGVLKSNVPFQVIQ